MCLHYANTSLTQNRRFPCVGRTRVDVAMTGFTAQESWAHAIGTALLAALGLLMAIALGSSLPVLALRQSSWLATPAQLPFVLLPAIMVSAALLGAMLAWLRPTATVPAVAVGLGLFVCRLLPSALLNGELLPVLFVTAADAAAALLFAAPFMLRGQVLRDGLSWSCYAVALGTLLLPVSWWFAGAPGTTLQSGTWSSSYVTSMAKVGPMTAQVPDTFGPVATDLRSPIPARSSPPAESFDAALQQAAAAGRIQQDPVLQSMRAAVLSTRDALRSNPCDAAARRQHRAAVVRFVSEAPIRSDRPIEMVTLAGHTGQASAVLNKPASEASLEAVRAGVVTPGDLPDWAREAVNQLTREPRSRMMPDPANRIRYG